MVWRKNQQLTGAGEAESRVARVVESTDGRGVEGHTPHEALLSRHDDRATVEDRVSEIARISYHRA